MIFELFAGGGITFTFLDFLNLMSALPVPCALSNFVKFYQIPNIFGFWF